MKKTTVIFGILALTGALALSSCKGNGGAKVFTGSKDSTAAACGIAYVDLDRITQEYTMAVELTDKVNNEAAALDSELKRRGSKIERDYANFQDKVNKGLLTQFDAEVQAKKIQEAQANFQNYLNAKQGEMQTRMVQVQEQIANSISLYIKSYNETAGYAMILSTQGSSLSVPVITAAEGLDITDDVIEGLNKQYEKNKNNPSQADTTAVK